MRNERPKTRRELLEKRYELLETSYLLTNSAFWRQSLANGAFGRAHHSPHHSPLRSHTCVAAFRRSLLAKGALGRGQTNKGTTANSPVGERSQRLPPHPARLLSVLGRPGREPRRARRQGRIEREVAVLAVASPALPPHGALRLLRERFGSEAAGHDLVRGVAVEGEGGDGPRKWNGLVEYGVDRGGGLGPKAGISASSVFSTARRRRARSVLLLQSQIALKPRRRRRRRSYSCFAQARSWHFPSTRFALGQRIVFGCSAGDRSWHFARPPLLTRTWGCT